jgi:hypothetical protein
LTGVRRRWRRALLAALLLIVGGCIGALVWLSAPVGLLMPEAVSALESDAQTRVHHGRWIEFEKIDVDVSSGIIFYPGGRVAPEAYAPLARAVAEAGYLAVIVPMPLNLAILNPDAASDVISAYPSIKNWVIGGHSLGGVMAARYAHQNRERVAGLALLAAYTEAYIDLSDAALAVASIYGSRDGLTRADEVENSLARLPADTAVTKITGGNHAQFGWYGPQSGDLPAQISRAEQHERLVAAILRLMHAAGS